MKPKDRIPAWPEQSAVMRVSNCCLVLQAILPEALFMQVRKEVCDWDTKNDPDEELSMKMRAAVNARWAKRRIQIA